MTNPKTQEKIDQAKVITPEVQKGIDNHKKAAKHLEEAAKNHHEAAKNHQEGNHENAYHNTIKAQGHLALATEAQEQDQKSHALNSETPTA